MIFGYGSSLFAGNYVKGYTRKDGTTVRGYYKSAPNYTKSDNYTTKGNINPYTGELGKKEIYDYNNYNSSKKSSKK